MIEVVTVNALSTIALLIAIEALYPAMRIIHVFLDNARYHHARAVQDWLALPGRRIRLHFVPAYCPHLNPIERLWGLMHKTVTHNRCHATYNGFCDAVLGFLRRDVPSRWSTLCDSVTEIFLAFYALTLTRSAEVAAAGVGGSGTRDGIEGA